MELSAVDPWGAPAAPTTMGSAGPSPPPSVAPASAPEPWGPADPWGATTPSSPPVDPWGGGPPKIEPPPDPWGDSARTNSDPWGSTSECSLQPLACGHMMCDWVDKPLSTGIGNCHRKKEMYGVIRFMPFVFKLFFQKVHN